MTTKEKAKTFKTSEVALQVLRVKALAEKRDAVALAYTDLFGVNFKALADGEKINPADYRTSEHIRDTLLDILEELATEAGMGRAAAAMHWCNVGPGTDKDLGMYELRIRS